VLWFALAANMAVATPYSTRASTLPCIPLDHWVTPFITEAIGRGILPGLSLADRPYFRESVARALRAERALADSTQRDYTAFEGWLIDRIETKIDPGEP
jgi:hypothetical protein